MALLYGLKLHLEAENRRLDKEEEGREKTFRYLT